MLIKQHCLYNYIGLRNVSDWVEDSDTQVGPKSGYYVNALPGMSSELADKSRNRENEDVEAFWDNVQQTAIAKLEQDMRAYIESGELSSGAMNFGQVLYQTRRPLLDSVIILASDESRGVYIKLPRDKFVGLQANALYVYSASVTTTSITIKDLGTEQTLHTIAEVELLAGLNTIEIDVLIGLQYGSRELFISIDAESVDSRLFKQDYLHWHSSHFACDTCYRDNIEEDAVYIQPATQSDGVLTKETQAYGVWVDAQVVCSMDLALCENKKILTRAYWYQLGVKLLEYKFASPRLNYFTSSNIENTKEAYENLKREYEKAIKLALNSVVLSIAKEDSLCVTCQESAGVSYGGQMP